MTRVVKEKAIDLNIIMVYLQPYSPDLNHIESGWKDLKRDLSKLMSFDLMVQRSREESTMILGERKQRYAHRWAEKFIWPKVNQVTIV